jgi:ATP adenylyltransferase/5',5'''-P-1,P-4-tetraphosphate phosphorylase II
MIIEEKPGKNQNSNWWAERSKKLLAEQKISWLFLQQNYLKLEKLHTREFDFDDFKIKIQLNPERIKSVSLDVSQEAINLRDCPLCIEQLPKEQDGLIYDKNYIILCNPYPIFEEHFTISKRKHKPQNIIGNYIDLLNLSRDLGSYYTLFYNGPKCGSSVPSHMHFQAGTKLKLPIENEFEQIKRKFTRLFIHHEKIEIRFVENYLRYAIYFESSNKGELVYAFKIFITAFKRISRPDEEPMINIISTYNESNKWSLIIFPRAKHRPAQFFEEGEKKLLVSPAAVDLGGLIITPREEDFNKITKNEIINIYNQVTLTKEYFEYLKKKIGEVYIN